MQSGAQRWAESVGDRVMAGAKSRAMPPLQLFQNLLKTAPEAAIPLWDCAVRLNGFTRLNKPTEVIELMQSAKDRMNNNSSVRHGFQSAIDALCIPDSTPQSDLVLPLANDSAIGQFAIQFSIPASVEPNQIVEILNSVIKETDSKKPRRVFALLNCLVKHLEHFPPARLERKHFDSLNPTLKKSIEAHGYLDQILSAKQIERDESRTKKLLASKKLIEDSIDVLLNLSLPAIQLNAAWETLAQQFSKLPNKSDKEAALSFLPKLIESLPADHYRLCSAPKLVSKAFELLAGDDRFNLLRIWAAPEKLRYKIFESVDLNTSVPSTWIEQFFADALNEFKQSASQKRKKQIWDKWESHRTQLAQYLLVQKLNTAIDVDMVFEWLSLTEEVSRSRLLKNEPNLARFLLNKQFLISSLIRLFNPTLKMGHFAVSLMSRIQLSDWRYAIKHSTTAQLRTLWELAAGLNKKPKKNQVKSIVYRRRFIISAFPVLPLGNLLKALGNSISILDVADLLRLWYRHTKTASGARLLEKTLIGQSPAWKQILGHKQFNNVRVTNAIFKMLELCNQKAFLDAVVKWPEQLAEKSIAITEVATLLQAAPRSHSFACAVENKFNSIQLLKALPSVQRKLAKCPLRLAAIEVAVVSSLRDLRYIEHLARLSLKRKTTHKPGHRFNDLYTTHELPKRSGGKRIITAPNNSLKRLQRRLLANGLNKIELHPAAHGFRRDHSIATNAAAHVGQPLVVNVDISGFFPNTKYQRILNSVRQLGNKKLSAPAYFLLAEICSYNGALPTGAPTSPVIGNIILRSADAAITKVAQRTSVAFTRYADDLTFSGTESAKKILPFVRDVLTDHGYTLDTNKTQLYRRGRQQLVTNLIVNDKVNLKRKDRRHLRAAVHARCNNRPVLWHDKPMDDAALQGRIALLNIVDTSAAAKLSAVLLRDAPNWKKGRIQTSP